MRPWVLLLHTLPNGLSHLDWLLEPESVEHGGHPLISFRISDVETGRPDRPDLGQFSAERIGNHRIEYLTYEGPISGDRGSVQRLSTGHCRILSDSEVFVVAVASGPGAGRAGSVLWTGTRRGDVYTFDLSSDPLSGHTGEG